MNRAKQFWALVRFQIAGNPTLLIWPLAFGAPLIFIVGGVFHDKYAPSLDLLVTNFNLFFIVIMGPMIVLPDLFRWPAATAAAANAGTEFLLTRAVDRRLVFRSRALIYLGLTLVIPLGLLLAALPHPDLGVVEIGEKAHAAILSGLPGSTSSGEGVNAFLRPILIPYGALLVRSWHVGTYLLTLLFTQGFLFLLQPLRSRVRNLVGLSVLLTIGLGPIFMPFSAFLSSAHDRIPAVEALFIWYGTHWVLFWVSALAASLAVQAWCERRFARMEF